MEKWSVTFRACNYKLFSMGVFHIFKIVQMVPNHANHHNWCSLVVFIVNFDTSSAQYLGHRSGIAVVSCENAILRGKR